MKSIECCTIRNTFSEKYLVGFVLITRLVKREEFTFLLRGRKALHVVRGICIRVLNVLAISKSFKFWIYCLYFVSLGPAGFRLLFIRAKTCVYIEPESMCKSKGSSSICD